MKLIVHLPKIIIFFAFFSSGCKEYLKHEFERAVSGFTITLVLGFILLIIKLIIDINNKKK